jgi:hypothetical protein
MALSTQLILQLYPAHTRHLDVSNHTREVIKAARPQELFGRCKCMYGVSERPYEAVGRHAYRFIIINDCDKWRLRQIDFSQVRRPEPKRHRRHLFRLHYGPRSGNDTRVYNRALAFRAPNTEQVSHLNQTNHRPSLHFSHHIDAVDFHCDLGDTQFCCDLLTHQTIRDQRHHFPFA